MQIGQLNLTPSDSDPVHQGPSIDSDFWALFTLAAGATHADAAVHATIAESVYRIGDLTERRVAELGSGAGRCAAAIAAFGPAELLAVEQSEILAAVSREVHPTVSVVSDDFANLARYGSFDVVFALAHLLFIQESQEAFVANLRHIRAAMPDFGVLVLEQFELTDQPRDYGSPELHVHEHTRLVDPGHLHHRFTVTRDSHVVSQHAMSSLVFDRSELDAVAREASFLISDEWEYGSPNGEVSRMYLLRAQKGFNYLSDLPDFLESWLVATHPRNDTPRSISIDEHGRARPQGPLAWGQGASLSRHHSEFADSIEPAIRPLVAELVSGWNFVTYSSCEGHVHTHSPRIDYSESYCGVLTFDEKQRVSLQCLLHSCCDDWESNSVQPRIRIRPLLGPTSQYWAVDLLVTRITPHVGWSHYQEERDRLVSYVCANLRAQRSPSNA